MQYSRDEKAGKELSRLGFGCMRFPRTALGQIDMKKTEALVWQAVEAGVNYFDTAYLYPGSEQALGEILEKTGLRKQVNIATKLPLGKCRTYEDFERIFQEQLMHLRTDTIEYYLIHNISNLSIWQELCALGIEKWIEEKKAAGQIQQMGFSFHGMQDQFMALLDAYDWDFCQIQYNYVNIQYQAGQAGLMRAAEKGLPVIIMEPLLGGKLATALPVKARERFRAVHSEVSPAAWAFRWLWSQKEVAVVLSGMNVADQLTENIQVADTCAPGTLTAEETAAYEDVIQIFNESYKVPCTGCNYCMPCPREVNIPGSFSAYNLSYAMGWMAAIPPYVTSTGSFSKKKDYSPSRCIGCGQCEKRCPQHIAIVSELQKVCKRMEPFWLRWAKKVITWQRTREK